jgi:hypothetical protein
MSPTLIEIAEDPGAYFQLPPSDIRLVLDDVVLVHRPASDSYYGHEANRLRLPVDPRERIEEIRAWFRSKGCTRWIWVLGPSSTPADLEHYLRAGRDLQTVDAMGTRALLLDHAPPPGPAEVDIRAVRTFEAFCHFDAVQSIAFDESGERRAETVASRPARWDAMQASGEVALVAYLDDVPAAAASMAPLEGDTWFLLGGATIPEARGRGLYRALIDGRWAAAAERGGAGLVVHAGPMSAPILQRLGFVDVGRIDLFLERDEAGARPGPD